MKSKFVVVMMFVEQNQTIHENIIRWYKVVVECLMFVMIMIKLNLTYAMFMINRYCHNFDFTHVVAV